MEPPEHDMLIAVAGVATALDFMLGNLAVILAEDAS